MLPTASSASSHLLVTPDALNAVYAICTPPMVAKTHVTHAAGSDGTPEARPANTPAIIDAPMAIHRAAFPSTAFVLTSCTANGTSSDATMTAIAWIPVIACPFR